MRRTIRPALAGCEKAPRSWYGGNAHRWEYSYEWNGNTREFRTLVGHPHGAPRSGWRCFHCGKIVWDQSDAEYAASLVHKTLGGVDVIETLAAAVEERRNGADRDEAVAYLKRQADAWRGIAAAMGYEPEAHLDVRPTAQWLIDRVAKFRAKAAAEAAKDARHRADVAEAAAAAMAEQRDNALHRVETAERERDGYENGVGQVRGELAAAQATITGLRAQLAQAQEALAPFKAVAELMRPLGAFENWPDDKEPSTFMPGAWPCWAAFRRASEVFTSLEKPPVYRQGAGDDEGPYPPSRTNDETRRALADLAAQVRALCITNRIDPEVWARVRAYEGKED